MPIDINTLVAEIEDGLPSRTLERMTQARKQIEQYNLHLEGAFSELRRDMANPLELGGQLQNESGLMHEIVDILTDHLYSPGPSRTWDQPAGQEFLNRVYADNHIDAIMQEADVLTHCADVAAVQVDADIGTFEEQPITLRLWGADEFHVWEDPDNRCQPAAVVTRDVVGQTTRYRLWTEEELRVLETRPNGRGGGRVVELVPEESGPNPYECLPFAFTHYKYPVRQFWGGGIGTFLYRSDLNVNILLSRQSEAIVKHMDPLPFIKNGWPGMRFMMEPQKFIILQGPRAEMGAKGVERVEGPEPFYLQANIDTTSAWEHVRGVIQQVLKACGIPQSAVEMDYSSAPSGIMLIINMWPLLQRTRKRQLPFSIYETDLARTILRCAGRYYHRADLLADAQAGALAVGWATVPTPVTQDWLDTERAKIEMGVSSVIKMVQAMLGSPREQAITYLEEVRADQQELERINPELVAHQEAQDQAQIEAKSHDQQQPPDSGRDSGPSD